MQDFSLTPNDLIELLPLLTEQEREELDRLLAAEPQTITTGETRTDLEANYRTWLSRLLPRHFRGEDQFAPHHDHFWEWGWSIEQGQVPTPPAYLAIWPRGGAKSTNAEGLAVACGARQTRKFGLYVCRTQPQADLHISSIQSMLRDSEVGNVYPGMSDPKVEQVGSQRRQSPWNRSVLTTASGFIMQSYGLQSAFRGVRVEEYRPDLIIVSDIDDIADRPQFVRTLLNQLAGSVLGAASNDCVILFEQNLIHHNSMMNQILTRETDVLSDRLEGGPIPAVYDIKYERRKDKWFIIGGTESWVGQGIATCQHKLNTEGKEWFDRECQHDVNQVLGRPRFNLDAILEYQPSRPTTGELVLKTNELGQEEIKFYPSPTGALSVWKRSEKGHRYAAGVDTAEGRDVGAQVSSTEDPDYCVAIIRDVDSQDQVAMLRSRMTEGAFGTALYAVLRWYNDPFVVPEVKGGYGRVTLNKILELGYPESLIFNRHMVGELTGQPKYKGEVSYHDLGWDTGPTNRPLLIDFLDTAILQHDGETYSLTCIEEYKHFCYSSNGKPEAEPGYHDDCVIADCLCRVAIWFAVRRRPRTGPQAVNYKTGQPAGQRAFEQRAIEDARRKRM